MKKLKHVALVIVFILISSNSFGGWFEDWREIWRERRMERYLNYHDDQQTDDAVGAPLDGGLLAILGVAGAAYFGLRKKKKENK